MKPVTQRAAKRATTASALVAPTDPALRRVAVDRTELAYTDEGPEQGVPVLLIHGVPGGVGDFRYLAAEMARLGARVIRLDMPGFGGSSEARWRDQSPAGRARAVIGVASALGLSRYAVAGHSIGGPAALMTAALDPERVVGLGLIASVGLSRHRGLPASPAAIRAASVLWHIPGLRGQLAKRLRRAYTKMGFPAADSYRAADFALHIRVVASLSFRRLRAAAHQVKVPSVVTFAEDDKLVEPAIGEALAATLQVDPLSFASGGHNLQKTRAADIAGPLARLGSVRE